MKRFLIKLASYGLTALLRQRCVHNRDCKLLVFAKGIKDRFHVKSRTLKKSCSRFPILLLHSNHLSGRTLWTCLVLGGVHPAGRSSHLKSGNFSKNAGDTQLWTIISRDLLGRFGRKYACWKGHIVYFQEKL
jgi:hypothetical protein